jgi:hypothetical protein
MMTGAAWREALPLPAACAWRRGHEEARERREPVANGRSVERRTSRRERVDHEAA